VVQTSKATRVARSAIAYKPQLKDNSVWIELLGACEAPPGHRVLKGLSQDLPQGQHGQQEEVLPHLHRPKPVRARGTEQGLELDCQKGMDFMHDIFWDSTLFRVLNIVDVFNHQARRITC
jgi:hypothetical protein